MKITKPGTIYALALWNIHGLWENAKEIRIGGQLCIGIDFWKLDYEGGFMGRLAN